MEDFANHVTDSEAEMHFILLLRTTAPEALRSPAPRTPHDVSKPRNSAAAACVLLLLYQRRICAPEMRAHILLDICNMLPLSLSIYSIPISRTFASDIWHHQQRHRCLPTNSSLRFEFRSSSSSSSFSSMSYCVASLSIPTDGHFSSQFSTSSYILKLGGLFNTVGLIAFACLIPPSSTAYTGYSAYTGARLSSASNSSIF